MDETEQFIKMSDCPEIQEKSGEYNGGCCFWANRSIDGGFSIWIDLHGEDSIWLPRQDDIQKMLGYGIGALVNDLYDFCVDIEMFSNPDNLPDSMEQLWLAFYMHEKHDKEWDGKKWLKKK